MQTSRKLKALTLSSCPTAGGVASTLLAVMSPWAIRTILVVVSSANSVMVLELLEMCLATKSLPGICLSGSSISSHRGCSRPKFPELHHELGGHQWNAELCSDTCVHLLQVGKGMLWRLRVLSMDLGSRHGGHVEEMKI